MLFWRHPREVLPVLVIPRIIWGLERKAFTSDDTACASILDWTMATNTCGISKSRLSNSACRVHDPWWRLVRSPFSCPLPHEHHRTAHFAVTRSYAPPVTGLLASEFHSVAQNQTGIATGLVFLAVGISLCPATYLTAAMWGHSLLQEGLSNGFLSKSILRQSRWRISLTTSSAARLLLLFPASSTTILPCDIKLKMPCDPTVKCTFSQTVALASCPAREWPSSSSKDPSHQTATWVKTYIWSVKNAGASSPCNSFTELRNLFDYRQHTHTHSIHSIQH